MCYISIYIYIYLFIITCTPLINTAFHSSTCNIDFTSHTPLSTNPHMAAPTLVGHNKTRHHHHHQQQQQLTSIVPLNLLLTPFYPLCLHIPPPALPPRHHQHHHTLFHSTIIPLKSKSEDSLFASDCLFVVSDGIGSWKQHGIDPSVYSKQLCGAISKSISGAKVSDVRTFKSLIATSIAALSKQHILGSATFCSLYIDINALELYSVSLGDTVFAILRDGAVLAKGSSCKYSVYFKSKEQYHSFNTPFQCGHISNDDVAHSIDMSFDIRERDVIVVGSDGLWDNISLDFIVDSCNLHCAARDADYGDVKALTVRLAEEAKANSKSKIINSPFSKRAKEHGVRYVGGKPDDIAVVVVLIKKGRKELTREKERDNSDNDIDITDNDALGNASTPSTVNTALAASVDDANVSDALVIGDDDEQQHSNGDMSNSNSSNNDNDVE